MKPLNKKTTIVAAICGAILLAAIVLLFALPSADDPEGTGAAKSLTNYDLSEVTGIDIRSNDGLDQYRRNGINWYLANEPAFDLDQQAALAVATNSAYLSIIETLEKMPEDLAPLGLAPAGRTVTLYLTDNSSVEILIGAETMDKTGRYALLKGDSKIVIIPDYAAKVFSATRETLFNRSVGWIDWGSFKELQMKKPGVQTIVVELNPARSIKKDAELSGMFLVTSPYKSYAKPDRIKVLFDDLSKMRFDDYLGYQQDLKEFGLDTPRLQCLVQDSSGNQMAFSIGNSVQQGDALLFYCNRPGDPNNVFTISEEKAAFSNTQPLTLADTELIPLGDGEKIGKLAVTNGQKTDELAVGDGSATLNGKALAAESAAELLETFKGIGLSGLAEDGVKKELLYSVTAEIDSRKAALMIYSYTEDLYVADQGFGQYLCLAKDSFEAWIALFDNY